MDRLSSCYFCGAAPDQPLETYRIADGSTTATELAVTLCPPCRRKLEAVLDSTTADVTGPTAPDVADHDRDTGASTGRPERDTTGQHAEAGGRHARNAGREDDADGTGTTAQVASSEGAEPPSESGDEAVVGHDRSEAERDREEVTETDDSPRTDETPAESDSETGGGGTTGQTPPSQRDASVTRSEYRKVVRLLQNREQPVERREIESLATSAYELTVAQCRKILDTAVEQGHLERRDGRLVAVEAPGDE